MARVESAEPPPAAQEDLGYLLRRVAVHLGARESLFATLIAAGARAEGWLAVEAFRALSGPLASRRVRGLQLGGVSQGDDADQPDLELEIDGRPLALRLLSVPIVPPRTPAEIAAPDGELGRQLRLSSGRDSGALLAVVYPLRPEDPAWQAGIADLERASGTAMVGQVQVLLAGPERVTVSLWM